MHTIEDKAFNILKEENLLSLPIDIKKLSKQLYIKIIEQEMEDKISGLLYCKEGTPYIGLNKKHHPNRKRFTIAHEIGHWTLHHPWNDDVIVDTKTSIFHRAEHLSSGYEKEKEANQFAAALLMPKELLLNYIDSNDIDLNDEDAIENMATKIKVSVLSLTYRLLNLGLINYK